MPTDHRYAAAMAKFAKEHGQTNDDPDLLKWADKLEQIIVKLAPPAIASPPAQVSAQDVLAHRYVGRLR
jgi:hypothetical protein